MRFLRSASVLVTSVVAAVALCASSGAAHARAWTAQAKTWSVPASVATKDAQEVTGDDLEDALMVEINAARAADGLSKIWTFDACTDRLAEQWGARIARTGRFEHRNQNEIIRRCNNSWAGETLVRGSSLTPADMVKLWLDSPPHREILLNPRAKRAGVAITEDSQGRVIGVVNLVRQN